MAQVTNVHFHPGEPDCGGHNAKGFDRLDFGVEETIADAGAINHVGLTLGKLAVAL
jgi:hypothetical protein